MNEEQQIGIFKIGDCDWWAGRNLEECITSAMNELGFERTDLEPKSRQLTEEELDTFTIVEWDDPVPENFTFRKALQSMIAKGKRFPCFFASTEY